VLAARRSPRAPFGPSTRARARARLSSSSSSAPFSPSRLPRVPLRKRERESERDLDFVLLRMILLLLLSNDVKAVFFLLLGGWRRVGARPPPDAQKTPTKILPVPVRYPKRPLFPKLKAHNRGEVCTRHADRPWPRGGARRPAPRCDAEREAADKRRAGATRERVARDDTTAFAQT
jgi:hypothetical protein